jgi:hypothetical protein
MEFGRDLGAAISATLGPPDLKNDVRPSLQPNSFSRCKAANQWLATAGSAAPKKPMVRNFACCARVRSGQAPTAPPSSVINSRLSRIASNPSLAV